MTKEDVSKLASYLGFAKRSGNATTGSELVLTTVRKAASSKNNEKIVVLVSSDSSDRTHKQITDKCTFYNVFCRVSPLDSYDTAKMLGKSAPVCAVAVTEASLSSAIKNLFLKG